MNAAKLTYLYDGACSVCASEVDRLRRRDAAGRLSLVDIASPSFDASAYGRSQHDLMARVHALGADGSVLVGMDAVRAVYAAVGLRWLVAPTAWPGLRPLFDRMYAWFARNRYRFNRRAPDLVAFYTATDADYGAWSRDFNMHFGYWERGIGFFEREAMVERMNVKVHERLRLPAGPVRVADLGCGSGASARSLTRRHAGARVSAVTNVPAQIARGERLGFHDAIDFVLSDYRDTGLAAGAYDGVYAIESACHAPGRAKRGVVDEAFRLLRPGGRLAIADCFVKRPLPRLLLPVYRRWCESWLVPDMPRVGAMRSALERAGFTEIEFTEVSWRVAPTVAHVPWVAARYVLTELLRGRLSEWRRRHAVASILSIVLGLFRRSIGYYIVAARKPA